MRRRAAIAGALAALMILPGAALAAGDDPVDSGGEPAAAEPTPDGDPSAPGAEVEPAPEEPASAHIPKPKRSASKLKVTLNGLSGGKLRLGKKMTAAARLSPSLSGEPVRFTLKRGKKAVARRTVTVDGKGKARWRIGPSKPGIYRVKAQHPRSSRMAPSKDFSKRFTISFRSLAQGNYGPDVALLNKRLRKLGFVTGGGSSFSAATGRAVLAYRKANRMARNELATAGIVKRIVAGKGGVKLRHPGAGRHVEADISRQILILANKGKAVRIYHTSSGASATPTILGKYRFYMYQPGYNNVGMYYSAYFIRGYAIHGYPSVPTHPASHGCLRVPIPDAIGIYNWVDIGMAIYTYK